MKPLQTLNYIAKWSNNPYFLSSLEISLIISLPHIHTSFSKNDNPQNNIAFMKMLAKLHLNTCSFELWAYVELSFAVRSHLSVARYTYLYECVCVCYCWWCFIDLLYMKNKKLASVREMVLNKKAWMWISWRITTFSSFIASSHLHFSREEKRKFVDMKGNAAHKRKSIKLRERKVKKTKKKRKYLAINFQTSCYGSI